MKAQPSYYEILGLQHDEHSLPADLVKKAYRKALLSHHPDKASKAGANHYILPQSQTVTVDEIALAYKTLSEPSLKAEYDRWLASSTQAPNGASDVDRNGRIHHTGLETLDLDDLAFDEDAQSWSRGCRCGIGGGYVVTEDELEKNLDEAEIIVGCKGCSLWLRVLFGVEQ